MPPYYATIVLLTILGLGSAVAGLMVLGSLRLLHGYRLSSRGSVIVQLGTLTCTCVERCTSAVAEMRGDILR